MSEDMLYEVLRIFGYVDIQKEIDRIHAGLATLDEKHMLVHKLRSECCAPNREYFSTNTEYDIARAQYLALKKQIKDLINKDTDSETSELAKIVKDIKSETVKKPVEAVKSKAIANPNLNIDKFHPRDDHRTIV